jgi:HEAT repeat protein
VAAARHIDLTLAIIERLTDDNATVRAEARAALKKLSEDREDFGPAVNATKAQQREAQQRWKGWWLKKTEK